MPEPFQRPFLTGHTTTVLTSWGRETYQVWLDELKVGWVARIVTLPNRIWAASGGREALKFYGATVDEAESAARRFIESECTRTNRRIAPPTVRDEADAEKGQRVTPAAGRPPLPAKRIPKRLLLRFGGDRIDRPGVTANLSETGLFVITDRPEPPGASVSVDLRMPEGPVPLTGVVIWTRGRREPGRSVGFGLRLTDKPPAYINGLRLLQPAPPPAH